MTGRRSERASRWQEILERQAASGLTAAAFCREESISQPSFYLWRRKLREDGGPASGSDGSVAKERRIPPERGAEILPVRIESNGSQAAVRIFLPQGVCVELSGAGMALADALQAVGQARLC
jgi:transposase-like protein